MAKNMPKKTTKTPKNDKVEEKVPEGSIPSEINLNAVENPLNLSARFLAARPDLVAPWIMGAHGLLRIFKSEHKEAIIAYLDTIQVEFFNALKAIWEKRHPEQKMTYTFGTICRNKRGEERLVIGIQPTEKGKPTYQYIDDNGKEGACNESSMVSWMEKQ